MNDPSILFEAFFRQYGFNRLDPNNICHDHVEHQLIEPTRIKAELLIASHRQNRGPQMPRFHFDFLDRTQLQAYAAYERSNHCGYVAVYIGAIWIIYDIFYRALSHPKILPDIGDATAESEDRPFFSNGLFVDYEDIWMQRHDGLAHVLPKDPQRRKHAETLAEIAIEFLVIHELAHITYGHFEYNNSPSQPFIMEFGRRNPSGNGLVSQYLEIVADSHAAITSFMRRLQKPTNHDRQARALLDRGKEIVVPDELLMSDWVFAVIYLFWLFDQDSDPNNLNAATHPPPTQRAILANAEIHRMLLKSDQTDGMNYWERARIKAARDTDNSFKYLGNGQMQQKLFQYGKLSEQGILQSHLEHIMDAGNAVKSEIGKYSHHTYSE